MLENIDHRHGEYLIHLCSGTGAKASFLGAKTQSKFLRDYNSYYIVDTTIHTDIFDLLDRLCLPPSIRNNKVGCYLVSGDRYLFFTTETRLRKLKLSVLNKKHAGALDVGQVIQGRIKNITSYGVFINLGRCHGLLHISEMSLSPIGHPSEVLDNLIEGSTIEVQVLKIQGKRVSLGLGEPISRQWASLSSELNLGQTISGQVCMLKLHFAVVRLDNGLSGRIHRDEISWMRSPTHTATVLSIGDRIEAQVIDIEHERRCVHLSCRQLIADPWPRVNEELHPGARARGAVKCIVKFGIFVEVLPQVQVLIHVSDLSWTIPPKRRSTIFAVGEEVEVIILEIDEELRRIKGGIKQLTPDPWINLIPEQFGLNSIHQVSIIKQVGELALGRIDDGVETLIHLTSLNTDIASIRTDQVILQARVTNVILDKQIIAFKSSVSHAVEEPLGMFSKLQGIFSQWLKPK